MRSQAHLIERDGYNSAGDRPCEFNIGVTGSGPVSSEVIATVSGGPASADDENLVGLSLWDSTNEEYVDFEYAAQEADAAADVAAALVALIDAHEAFAADGEGAVMTITSQAVPSVFTSIEGTPEFVAASAVVSEFWNVSLSGGFPQTTTTATVAAATASGNLENRVTISITTDNGGPYTFSHDVTTGQDEDAVAAALATLIDAHAELTATPTDNTIAIGVQGAATTMNAGSISATWIGSAANATTVQITVTGGPATDDDITVVQADITVDAGGLQEFTYSVQNAEDADAAATGLAADIDGSASLVASAVANVITVTLESGAAIDTHIAYPEQRLTVAGGGTDEVTITVLGITATAGGLTTAALELVIDGGTPIPLSHPVTSGQTRNQVAAALATLIDAEEQLAVSRVNNVVTASFNPEAALLKVVKGLKRVTL